MARIRNLKLNDVTVEHPYYTDSEGTRHQLTKWIHNGVVVWENGGSYKGIYYMSNNSSYAYSYLRYYDFDTGEDTRILGLRTPVNQDLYRLYVDSNGVFFIASSSQSGNYGYSYYGYKDITQRTRIAIGIGRTNIVANPIFCENGIFVSISSGVVSALRFNGSGADFETNISEASWNYSNNNVISYGDYVLSGGSYLMQYNKNSNEYTLLNDYSFLGRSTEQYDFFYSDSRVVTFDNSVFAIIWLRYKPESSSSYLYEEHLVVYDENGQKRHSSRFVDSYYVGSGVKLISTENKVYRIGNDDNGEFAIKTTTNGIDYTSIDLPDYLDVYTRDRTQYVRIVFNGTDTYPASEGTKIGSALAKNLLSQSDYFALKNNDDEIERLNGLIYIINGYYVYIDNYEMQNSDGNIAFQRQY